MRTSLIVLSSILTVGAVLPYILEVIRGKTKPRIVSWLTWSVLTGIASAASFADGQVPSGVLLSAASLETALVVVLGFGRGDRKVERLDIFCLACAITGLLLWLVFNSPSVAVIATVGIDLIGAIPTFRHSWQKPHEETWITYAASGVGGGMTVLVAGGWRITAVAYPLYILLVNVAMTYCILGSPNRKIAGEPVELRDL